MTTTKAASRRQRQGADESTTDDGGVFDGQAFEETLVERPESDTTGRLDITGEHPVVEAPEVRPRPITVVINISRAHLQRGYDAIHVDMPEANTLTAAEGHRLCRDLGVAVDVVSQVRQQLGYTA